MKDFCRSCHSRDVIETLALGPQPASNRFLVSPGELCDKHPLNFGYCQGCGLAQLLNPAPSASIRSPHIWLSYNEPESHLDHLVEILSTEFVSAHSAKIRGLTYKDDTTLERLKRLGFSNPERLDIVHDLCIRDPSAGLETIQSSLTSPTAQKIISEKGTADLLIVRHLLEHAHSPIELLRACQTLTAAGGVMVFEVPDARKMLTGGDHCFLWEEHIVYFTADTLRRFFEQAGLSDVEVRVYSYAMEDSLVAIVRNTTSETQEAHPAPEETSILLEFTDSFDARSRKVRNHLQALSAQGKSVAMFGAGHLSLKFINFYELAPYIQCVIDDNPHKQGLFMCGSGLPIVPSSCLETYQIDLCILGLNLESERKVCEAKADYIQRGGKFLSAFSASSKSIDSELSNA